MSDRNEYFRKYKKDNYKRIPLDVTKNFYEQIKLHAESMHESVNGFIKRAINECIKNDTKKH